MATAKKTATRKPASKASTPARKAAPRKAPVRPAARAAAPQPAPRAAAPAGKTPKADKPKKPKLMRDSFTMPKADYAVLQALKARAARAGGPAKKSEVLRAGIKALADMGDAAFAAAMRAVPTLKTGRPAQD